MTTRGRSTMAAIRHDGGVADACTADVIDEREVADLVAAVADRLGPVEVLVLNATDPQPEAPLAAVAWEDHVARFDFFVNSPVLLGRDVLPRMQAKRFGHIVQIDSEVADRPRPGRFPAPPPRARRSVSLAAGRASSLPSASP